MQAVFVLTREEVTEMAAEALGRTLAAEETDRVCELVGDVFGMVWWEYAQEAIRAWIEEGDGTPRR